MKSRSTPLIVPTLLAGVLVLGACAGDGDDVASSGSESTSATADASPANVDAAIEEPDATDADDSAATEPTNPAEVPPTTSDEAIVDVSNMPATGEFTGALDDVEGSTCVADGGRWTASGSVTNPTANAVAYRIYVSFLDAAGETAGVIESGADDVAPGATAEWSATLESGATGLRCVLRVERRDV